MLSPRFSIVLVFCLSFLFSGSFAHSGRPTWAAVMWDVNPQDMEKPGIGKASWNYYLLYHLDQLWSSFEHLDPLGSMEVLYKKSTELGLLLMLIYLWRTVRRACREVSNGSQASQTVPKFLRKRHTQMLRSQAPKALALFITPPALSFPEEEPASLSCPRDRLPEPLLQTLQAALPSEGKPCLDGDIPETYETPLSAGGSSQEPKDGKIMRRWGRKQRLFSAYQHISRSPRAAVN